MNSVNKILLRSQNTYLTPDGSGDDNVHVSSLITPTLRCENVWGYAFSKNRSSLSLLSVRFDAMTTRLFLPTNRRLILEWPSNVGSSPTIGIFLYVAQAVERVLAVALGNKLCWFESHYRHISLCSFRRCNTVAGGFVRSAVVEDPPRGYVLCGWRLSRVSSMLYLAA